MLCLDFGMKIPDMNEDSFSLVNIGFTVITRKNKCSVVVVVVVVLVHNLAAARSNDIGCGNDRR